MSCLPTLESQGFCRPQKHSMSPHTAIRSGINLSMLNEEKVIDKRKKFLSAFCFSLFEIVSLLLLPASTSSEVFLSAEKHFSSRAPLAGMSVECCSLHGILINHFAIRQQITLHCFHPRFPSWCGRNYECSSEGNQRAAFNAFAIWRIYWRGELTDANGFFIIYCFEDKKKFVCVSTALCFLFIATLRII